MSAESADHADCPERRRLGAGETARVVHSQRSDGCPLDRCRACGRVSPFVLCGVGEVRHGFAAPKPPGTYDLVTGSCQRAEPGSGTIPSGQQARAVGCHDANRH
jgi:hypothetical protein